MIIAGLHVDSIAPNIFPLFSESPATANSVSKSSKNNKIEIEAQVIKEILYDVSKMHLLHHYLDVIHSFESYSQYSINIR